MYVRRHSAPFVDLTHNLWVSDGSKNDLSDTSEPLFSLYSEMVEDGDNQFADRYQKDAEGILLFVSPRSCLRAPKHLN